jgi:N-acetylmuramoyl-L-alanine amidase
LKPGEAIVVPAAAPPIGERSVEKPAAGRPAPPALTPPPALAPKRTASEDRLQKELIEDKLALAKVAPPALAAPPPLTAKQTRNDDRIEKAPADETPPAPALAAKRTASGDRTLIRALGLKVRRVVIDPGHGGENPGARGPGGTVEKDIALAIARRLRSELVNARGLQVFLTRDKDVDMELDDRTAIANNYKADLFVSIHANASRARGAKGSEVYFLSYQASDDDSRRIAQLEGAAEPLPGASVGSDLALILWDMAQAEHLEESSALASRIQEELAVVTGSEGRGVKQAPFRVLVGAAMPAVLVEIAFISNPDEEKLLASETYQAKIAASLARGIERYRRERTVRLSGARASGSTGQP